MSKNIVDLADRIRFNPRGAEADASVAIFEAWAECINNILRLDVILERDNSHAIRDAIRKEVLEWGFELDAAEDIVTGIKR